jgi:hypothetical protein
MNLAALMSAIHSYPFQWLNKLLGSGVFAGYTQDSPIHNKYRRRWGRWSWLTSDVKKVP